MSQIQNPDRLANLKQIQNGFARRVVMYWCVTWLIVFTLPIMVRMINEQGTFAQLAQNIIADFWFPIVVSFLILPVIVCDSLRFARRMADSA